MKGHVRKRGSKWVFVVDVGRDEKTGKRIRKWFSGYDTKKLQKNQWHKKYMS